VLEIGDTYYSVRPNRTHTKSIASSFRLRKADGTIYDVAMTRFGAECDCPDFLFRRAGLDPLGCKHVQALVACGLFPEPERN